MGILNAIVNGLTGVALVASPFAALAAEKPLVPDPGFDIIIIAGQSNAVGYGCGPFTDVSHQKDHRIFQVMPDGDIEAAVEPLTHAHPLSGQGGKGFGMTFARLYAAESLSPDRQVLLVPVALGATSIIQWDNVDEDIDFDPGKVGAPIRFDTTELYDSLMRQTRLALRGGGPKLRNRIAAVLWHQGETDFSIMHVATGKLREKMPDTAAYGRRLAALMKLYRQELKSDFPLVIGEIGAYLPIAGAPTTDEFNQVLKATAAAVGKTAVASAEGLLPGSAIRCSFNDDPRFPEGDPYHINSAGQVEFGRRYYKAFQAVSR